MNVGLSQMLGGANFFHSRLQPLLFFIWDEEKIEKIPAFRKIVTYVGAKPTYLIYDYRKQENIVM